MTIDPDQFDYLSKEDELELLVAERTKNLQRQNDAQAEEIKNLNEQLRLAREQLDYVRNQRKELRETVAYLKDTADGNYWAWDNEGMNDLHSLSCPVLISPQDLQAIINGVRGKWKP